MKRTIVMGKGTLAIRIAEWFLRSDAHELVCVVPVIPEPTWTDSLVDWARDNGVRYVESGDYRQIAELADDAWRPELAFSVFYDKIIREAFIGRCGRILNLHNGPLPRYRGVSPINWALKNREELHGATIHEITPGIDDGPIVAQVKFSIYPKFDEVIDVYERALAYGWTLFEQTIPLLDRIEARPQNDADATYFSHADDALLAERRGFTRAFSLHGEREAEAAANPC